MSEPALFVFAKAPIAGQAKTRLTPPYSPDEAAEIASLLIRATLARAIEHWRGPVYLATAPDANHPLFRELAARYHVALRDQCGADLGARMQAAIADGVARHGAAAILGCDVPHCPGSVLIHANATLAAGRAVFGPTRDGGYYLIGLTRAAPTLFGDMRWGTDTVWQDTLARAKRMGVAFEVLPMLRDIDTADDLRAVASEVEALRRFGV